MKGPQRDENSDKKKKMLKLYRLRARRGRRRRRRRRRRRATIKRADTEAVIGYKSCRVQGPTEGG